MRSTLRRRAGLAVLALVVVTTACSDDDDATAGVTASTGLAVATPGVIASDGTAGGTVGADGPADVASSEPDRPVLDDTIELGGSQLSTVDLTTGAATPLGRIGGEGEDVGILGLAFVPGSTTSVYGLTDAPVLVTFDVAEPSTLTTTVPITGVADGSTLLAIDVDLEDGTLYALSDAAVLYTIDPATGAASAIGTGLGEPLPDPGFGFDVDPTTALVRVELATGEHLLVVPSTGTVDADAESVIGQPVSYDPADAGAGVAPRVVALAFTANGELYVVDAATGNLAHQDPPDAGLLTTIGPLGIDLTDGASFDISADGQALIAVPG